MVLYTGCGKKDNWGVNQNVETAYVTHGPKLDNGNYRCSMEKGDATLIQAGQRVKPLSDNTRLKIWHYQNSDEYVCVVRGEAILLSD